MLYGALTFNHTFIFKKSPDTFSLALEISDYYRSGYYTKIDKDQADLWWARSVIYCHQGQFVFENNIKSLTFFILISNEHFIEYFKSIMTKDEIDRAQQNADQLLLAVAKSEKQFPRPSTHKDHQD